MQGHGFLYGRVAEGHGDYARQNSAKRDEPSPSHDAQHIIRLGRGYECCTTTTEGSGIIVACTRAHGGQPNAAR